MNANTGVESVKVFKIDNWKSFLVLDLICVLCQLILIYFYVSNAPYSDSVMGFGVVILCAAIINLIAPVIFIIMDSWGFQIDRKKGSKHMTYLGIISSIILYSSAMFIAPDNRYDTHFKSNAIDWLNQGNCTEINKYDEEVFSLCEKMTQVRKNVAGTFVVMSKSFDSSAIVCEYFVQSEKDELGIRLYFQPCESNIKQKVEVTVKAVEYVDTYKYKLLLKAI